MYITCSQVSLGNVCKQKRGRVSTVDLMLFIQSAYAAKNYKLFQIAMKTGCNDVIGATLFLVFNNIELHYFA